MSLPDNALRHTVILVALLAAGYAAAWLRFLPYLEHEATFTDGDTQRQLDDVERLRFAVWDEPVPLPPLINDGQTLGRATVSPDGRLLVFAAGEPGLNVDLWAAELIDGEPGEPWPLDRLNSSGDDTAPLFAGETLWFASNRAGGMGGFDILRAPLVDGVPGVPERLPPGLNSEHDELDPAPIPGSGALAFASDRPRGRRSDSDLYLAVPFAPAPGSTDPHWRVTALDPLNTAFDERGPAFALDGKALFFASDRAGGAGGVDLYRSLRDLDSWLPPEPLAGLNSAADEEAPTPSADGFALHFTQGATGGAPAALQRARSIELFRVPGRPVGWLDLTVIGLLLLLALAAWLGKRWEALDILYKCLLASLLIHLLLMLWFQEVAVEGEVVELPEAAPTFKVRLSASPRVTARSAERNGRLDTAPTRDAAADAPGRAETGEVARAAAAASAAAALAAPSVGGAAAPARQAAELARGEVQAEQAVQVADGISESAPLLSADAPTLSLAAAAGPSPHRSASPAAAAPARQVAVAERFSGPVGEVAPRAPSLTVPVVSAGPGLPGPSHPVDPISRAGSGAPVAAVEVAAPVGESFASPGEQLAGSAEAPGLSLDALASAAAAAPAGRQAPRRPGRAGFSAAPERGEPVPAALPDLSAALASPGPVIADGRAPAAGAGPSLRELADVSVRDLAATDSEALGQPAAAVGEDSPGLTLAAASTGATRRRDDAPARPGRWSGRADLADAPARPAVLPLAAPVVAAASLPDLPVAAPHDHTPYRSRFGEARVSALEEHGGNAATEAAVAAGLGYLAATQDRDGHWGSEDDYHEKYGHVIVGKTGLALLAFLGAGHLPDGSSEHAGVARRARDFLLAVQDEATGHFGYSASYSHAIATYALAECHALTADARLRPPLERAVAWIVQHQDRSRDPRRSGGWGYYYPDGRIYDRWPRTSVTVWQVMALESAQLGGLTVERRVFDDAARFLRRARDAGGNSFTYSEDPERLNSVYPVLPGSTPAGLFALSLLGEDIAGPTYRDHVAFVRQRLPDRYEQARTRDFVNRAAGNLYFWYYGTLAMFRHGGAAWDDWNRALQQTLLPAQRSDGSWEAISLYATYAGDDARDRSYTTALNVLTLEVYYRYFTPLLQVR